MAEVPEEVSLIGSTVEPISQAIDEKRSLRYPSSRSLPAKSIPKFPLMRMAEMRKRGLRGGALRQSGKMGFDGLESLAGKGKKGSGGRGSRVLDVIPESSEVGEGSPGGMGLEGSVGGGARERLPGVDGIMIVSGEGELSAGVGTGEGALEDAGGRVGAAGVDGASGGLVSEMLDDRINVDPVSMLALVSPQEGSGEGGANLAGKADVIPAGMHSDLALDLISAQTLQEMEFIGEQVS